MTSIYKLHIHRRAKHPQVNLLAVSLAQQVAVGAKTLHDLVLCLRDGVVDHQLPRRQRQANDAAYSVTRHTQFPADDPRREQQQAEREQARQRGRDAIEQLGELAPHVMGRVPGLRE